MDIGKTKREKRRVACGHHAERQQERKQREKEETAETALVDGAGMVMERFRVAEKQLYEDSTRDREGGRLVLRLACSASSIWSSNAQHLATSPDLRPSKLICLRTLNQFDSVALLVEAKLHDSVKLFEKLSMLAPSFSRSAACKRIHRKTRRVNLRMDETRFCFRTIDSRAGFFPHDGEASFRP